MTEKKKKKGPTTVRNICQWDSEEWLDMAVVDVRMGKDGIKVG